MSTDADLIEQIVTRVLQELGTGAAASSTQADAAPHADAAYPLLGQAVITAELLETATQKTSTVRVTPRAILTPSARDLVRSRGLEIVRDAAPAAARPARRWQVLMSAATSATRTALDALSGTGMSFERRTTGPAEETATQAVSALCRGEADGVLALTTAPEHVACLANRNERVRAASLTRAAAVARVFSSLQPNLWAIDPQGQTAFELRQLFNSIFTSV